MSVEPEDLRIESVSWGNWVKVTHLPSGIVVVRDHLPTKRENIDAAVREIELRLAPPPPPDTGERV